MPRPDRPPRLPLLPLHGPCRAGRRHFLRQAPAAALGLAALPLLPASSARAAGASRPGPVVVWFTVEGAKAMRAVARRFTEATGVEVVVETPDDGPAKFQQAAAAGKGPDIYVYAHDRIGEWIAGGLILPVTPHRDLMADIDPLGWQGFRQRGRLWGYPLALEAITLVWNRSLVATPPRTFEELLTLDDRLKAQGRRAILWDYTNTYFSWPLLAAQGGYPFKTRPDGSVDPRDTGVHHPGAVAGARLIERMIREGRMPAGSGYPEMEAAMAQGRVAMMINGPWSWVNLQRVGVDFGIAKIPTVGGQPARPFVGVRGLMINRATRQRELVVEFIEQYLLQPEGLRQLDQAEPLGAPASRRFYAELAQRPAVGERVAGIMASARDGVPTPSNPEMGRFWSSMKTALTHLSEGRQPAEQALQAAARRIVPA